MTAADDTYPIRIAAELCGMRPEALRRRVNRGSLPAQQIDGLLHVRRADLEAAGLWPSLEAADEQKTIAALRAEVARLRGALAASDTPAERAERDASKRDERRRAVALIAAQEFGRRGTALSTEVVAERAGLSQAALLRMFGGKRQLVLAAVEAASRAVSEALEQTLLQFPVEQRLDVFAAGWQQFMGTPDGAHGLFQLLAACSDAEIEQIVREGVGDLFILLERVTEASYSDLAEWFEWEMAVAAIGALGAGRVFAEPWGSELRREPPSQRS